MVKNYFKMALRSLLKNKVSSILNISGLAVGLGTGILMLLVILDQISYDTFNKNIADIRILMTNHHEVGGTINTRNGTPGPLAASLRDELPDVKFAARTFSGGKPIFRNGDKAIYLESLFAEADFFQIMTFPALKGNPANVLKEPGSVVLTESAAHKLFGDEEPLGKLIQYNNINNLKVSAVIRDVPPNSTNRFEVALPFSLFEEENDWVKRWDSFEIQTWVQINQNTTDALMKVKLNKLFRQKKDQPNKELFAYPFAKLNLYDRFVNGKPAGGQIDLILILIFVALLILSAACINYMNLATARSEHRAQEVGVRKVMGASRILIIVQFLSEALLLSFFALLVGIALAMIFLPGFMQISLNYFAPDYFNWKLWLLLLSLGLLTGLVSGSYPAFYLSRFQPVKVLRKLVISGKGGGLLRKGLVTVQFMISIFLVICTIVMFKQVGHIQNRTIGYNPDNLVDIPVNGNKGYRIDLAKNELLRVSGVKNVTATSDNLIIFHNDFTGLEWPGKKAGQYFNVISTTVQYDWAKTIGVQLIEGRDFSQEYGMDSLSCIINESAAKGMQLVNPLGTKLGKNTVIGMVKDFVYNNPASNVYPLIIFLGKTNINHLFVRITNDNNWQRCVSEIENTLKHTNPEFPFEYTFVRNDYQKNIDRARFYITTARIAGSMAIFISCLGLFGLSSFLAERRKKEISIRKLLGASETTLWLLLSKDFFKPVLIAFLLSAPLAGWVMQKVLQLMDYHISLSPWIFIGSGLLTLFIALITTSYNGIKAALVNPVKNLNSE